MASKPASKEPVGVTSRRFLNQPSGSAFFLVAISESRRMLFGSDVLIDALAPPAILTKRLSTDTDPRLAMERFALIPEVPRDAPTSKRFKRMYGSNDDRSGSGTLNNPARDWLRRPRKTPRSTSKANTPRPDAFPETDMDGKTFLRS